MHEPHGHLNTASILLSAVVAVGFLLYVLFNFFRESRKNKGTIRQGPERFR